MTREQHPRRGSLQVWPRKRAKRQYARIRSWSKVEGTKLLGFIGYKTGMSQLIVKDNTQTSRSKNLTIPIPITIIECPPIKPVSIRFYKKDNNRDLKLIAELFSKNLHKSLKRIIKLSKKNVEEPKTFDDIKLVVHTQPWLAGVGKKTPEILELGVSGSTPEEKLTHVKALLEKEIKISDIFKVPQFIDTHSVSRGRGFQGPVRRFGVKLLPHKSEKKKRGPGALGPWHPHKATFRVARAGQHGYHQRTEYNKLILKIGNKPEEVNPLGGFLRYGIIKNDFVLIKGSIPGPAKRAIILTEPVRVNKDIPKYEIKSVNLASKQ